MKFISAFLVLILLLSLCGCMEKLSTAPPSQAPSEAISEVQSSSEAASSSSEAAISEPSEEIVENLPIPPEPAFIREKVSITTEKTDMSEIGKLLFTKYYDNFLDENLPNYYRMLDYTITTERVMAGDINEFAVAFDFSCHYPITDGHGGFTYHFIPNGYCEGENDIIGAYRELRIKKTADNTYEVISMGTGGGGMGLEPIVES